MGQSMAKPVEELARHEIQKPLSDAYCCSMRWVETYSLKIAQLDLEPSSYVFVCVCAHQCVAERVANDYGLSYQVAQQQRGWNFNLGERRPSEGNSSNSGGEVINRQSSHQFHLLIFCVCAHH